MGSFSFPYEYEKVRKSFWVLLRFPEYVRSFHVMHYVTFIFFLKLVMVIELSGVQFGL